MNPKKRIPLLCTLSFLTVLILQSQTAYSTVEDGIILKDSAEKSNVLLDYEDLIGSCTCKSILRDQQGQWKDTISLRWKWDYIMDGKGVKDEGWYIQNNTKHHFTSIRVYDTINKLWYVSYFTPNLNSIPQTWTGGKKGDNIILRKKQPVQQGLAESVLTFSNISKKGFDWEGKIFNKEKNINYPFWKIWCVKD